MQKHTICLRCHQKCHLVAEVKGGEVKAVVDAAPNNRIPSCREVCPIGMDVPGYVIAASQGRFDKAMEILRDTNPLPAVCGRICHHPCEEACIRGVVDEEIAIKSIKRFVSDYALKSQVKPPPISCSKEEDIAIIGAGPAGLTAAHDLVKAGFGVTVYEAFSEAGGMLIRVIPEFKLPKVSVREDIEYLKALGVNIRTNTPVGRDLTIESLHKKYKAVLIAIGSWTPGTLKIPGSDLQGVYYALPFLEEIKDNGRISMADRAVVIGGGNTAMDAARSAVRLGAKEVHVACLESLKAMPADPEEIKNAIREGIEIHPSLAPERFRDDGGKQIAGADFRRVASFHTAQDGNLTWTLQEGSGSRFSLDADTVILAIGQKPSLASLRDCGQLKLSTRGTLVVDARTMA
ncbi:MAG: FAD-dependent oxidoreductase, partial [Desulfatiglandaceae bacterium]